MAIAAADRPDARASSFVPTREGAALYDQARRADDAFDDPRFGPVGQYRMCDLCGGTFESRGLRLCPDCYEIRKQEPGFDDDRRWSSAAGKVAFGHRLCLWCGAPIERLRAGRKVRVDVKFCHESHGKAWQRASAEERDERARRLRDLRG